MRRDLPAAVIVLGLSAAIAAAQPTAASIRVEQVRPNLYLLSGGGPIVQIGNTGITLQAAGATLAFVASTGVVLVDTKLPGLGNPIREALAQITNKRITTIINTHAHDDHTGADFEFDGSVEIIAQENAAARMRRRSERSVPIRTFKDRLTLGTGDERIDLYYFGAAHTDGDTWVVFPALGVVHAGDVFAYRTVPIADTANGGNAVAYPAVIDRAAATLPFVQTVVTGHYPTIQTMADLRSYADFTRDLVQSAQAAMRAGQSIDEFVSAYTLPDRFARQGYVVAPLILRPFVQAVWNQRN